jgi:hypothetical protein
MASKRVERVHASDKLKSIVSGTQLSGGAKSSL